MGIGFSFFGTNFTALFLYEGSPVFCGASVGGEVVFSLVFGGSLGALAVVVVVKRDGTGGFVICRDNLF